MPQQTTQSMPMRPQQGGGMMSGIGSTIVTGMAFGAGSEIAHQAVRGIIGGGSHGSHPQENENHAPEQTQTQPQQQSYQNPCMSYNQKFVECLKVNGNDISDCQNFFNDLKSCEKGII